MRAVACLRTLIIIACASAGTPGAVPGLNGVARAEAKEFYTRKRVNGKWITGHFPKRTIRSKAASIQPPKRSERGPATELPPAAPLALQAQEDAARRPHVKPATSQSLTDDERLMALQKALEARAGALAAASPPALLSGTRAPDATGSLSTSLPNPQSVSFDFRTGMKTTVFTGGAQTTEPFDVEAVRPLASPHPGAN